MPSIQESLCSSSEVECDEFGTPVTEKGFYADDGRWQDMTDYKVDTQKKELVNYVIESTIEMTKIGESMVKAD